jgi:LuxR family maltose regulon positive regulatory protein
LTKVAVSPAKRLAASGPQGLLATKLFVPGPHAGFVHRSRLVDQLNVELARDVILISAPAGFGKTVLLADWTRRLQQPAAWLSLDAGDNDPTRFWRHVAAALERVVPGIVDRITPLLASSPTTFAGVVTDLINEMVNQPADAVLVLDDYHLVESQPVHDSLTFLLDHLPPGLRLVISSRDNPPLPLARLRARGQLAELGTTDLRFTVEEATAFLREAVGHDLLQTDIAALVTRAEGWPAGLQLAALSLRGQPDMAGFVASFSGRHRYVLDYLAQETLDRQPERVREFLLQTSILGRLSAELCEAITGRDDSQEMLEAIERANLFLIPLDDVRGWWRYHQLFADLLRVRLQQAHPDLVAQLHRHAAGWYQDHDFIDDAIGHAIAAAEMTWAARMIEQHFDALFLMGERTTIQRWLAALPLEMLRSRPRLCLVQTFLELVGGDIEAIEIPLGAAERAAVASVDEPFAPSVGQGTSWLANIPAAIALGHALLAYLRGDAEETVEFASRARNALASNEWMLDSVARWHLAVADRLCGRLEEAERAFTSGIAEWHRAGELGLAAVSCHHLGQVQRAQGRLDAALRTYQQTLEILAAPGRQAQPAAGIAYVGMAEVAYERNDLEVAGRHVSTGIALCRQLSYIQPLAMGLATLAAIRSASGDAAGANEAMAEAMHVAPGPTVASLLNPVPAQHARWLLAQGDITTARRWTEERGLCADDEVSYVREPEHLALARVLLALHEVEEALRLLERLHTLALAQGRIGSRIEIQVLRALALAANGAEAEATAILTQALTFGCPRHYVRVFVDEGAALHRLLGRVVAAQRPQQSVDEISLDYLGRLTRALSQDAARGASNAKPDAMVVPDLVTQLSRRERDVLLLLAAGKSNREIADDLYVTLDTTKKHVTHILAKLGASNRTEATVRARALGLLP